MIGSFGQPAGFDISPNWSLPFGFPTRPAAGALAQLPDCWIRLCGTSAVLLDNDSMTPLQCRAARSLLGLSQAQLGELAHVTELMVRNFEGGKTTPSYATWRALKSALEQSDPGIIFIEEDEIAGPG
jgi:DNA-binding XRE family transcriptional regulator